MIENYLQRRSLTTCFFGSQFETMTVTTKVWKQYPNWIPWYLVQFFLGIQGKNWTNRENWKIHRNWDTPKDTGRLEISVNIFMFCTISGCARSSMVSKPASRYAQTRCYNQICLKLLLCHNTLLVPKILPYHYSIVSFFLISWGCSYVFFYENLTASWKKSQ